MVLEVFILQCIIAYVYGGTVNNGTYLDESPEKYPKCDRDPFSQEDRSHIWGRPLGISRDRSHMWGKILTPRIGDMSHMCGILM